MAANDNMIEEAENYIKLGERPPDRLPVGR